MPTRIERHNILLSCPGDVAKLVPTVFGALEDFNNHYSDSHQIELHGMHWSRDMYPKSGGKPQDLINEVVVPNCDAAIAIFWCDLGSPTDKYESGTVEEIEQMLDTGRQVFLYFSKENPSFEVAMRGIDPRIADFKERYKNRGVYWEFGTEKELSELLSKHLWLHFIDHAREDRGMVDDSVQRAPLLRLVGVANGRASSVALLHDSFLSPRQQDAAAIREEIRHSLASAAHRYADILEQRRKSEELKAQLATNGLGMVSIVGALANLNDASFSLRPGSPVTVKENTKRIIQKIAEKDMIDLPEGFLSFEKLTHLAMPSDMAAQYYGPEEEEQRFLDIVAIEEKISDFCLWKSAEEAYGGLSNVVLALENAGTMPDEDIDVYLSIPTDALILPVDIPRQDECWLSKLEDKVGISEYFAPRTGIRLRGYSEADPRHLRPTGIRYDRDSYALEEFLECFPYDCEEDGEMTTVRLNFSNIKQHTTIAFPTPLFLRRAISSISYEIVSRHVGDVVRGVLYVTRECH